MASYEFTVHGAGLNISKFAAEVLAEEAQRQAWTNWGNLRVTQTDPTTWECRVDCSWEVAPVASEAGALNLNIEDDWITADGQQVTLYHQAKTGSRQWAGYRYQKGRDDQIRFIRETWEADGRHSFSSYTLVGRWELG